jgi:hypothetical protein
VNVPTGSALARRYYTVVGDYDLRREYDDRAAAEHDALEDWARIPDGSVACPPQVDENWVMASPHDALDTTTVLFRRTMVAPELTAPDLEEGDPVPTQRERAAVRHQVIEQQVRERAYAWPA